MICKHNWQPVQLDRNFEIDMEIRVQKYTNWTVKLVCLKCNKLKSQEVDSLVEGE